MEKQQKPKFKWLPTTIIFGIGLFIGLVAYIIDTPAGWSSGYLFAAILMFVVLPILGIGALVGLISLCAYLVKKGDYESKTAE